MNEEQNDPKLDDIRNLPIFGLDCIKIGKPVVDSGEGDEYVLENSEEGYFFFGTKNITITVAIELLPSYAECEWHIGFIQALTQNCFLLFTTPCGEFIFDYHPLKEHYYTVLSDSSSASYSPFHLNDKDSKLVVKRGIVPSTEIAIAMTDVPIALTPIDHLVDGYTVPINGGVNFREYLTWIVAMKRGNHRLMDTQFNRQRFQKSHDRIFTAYTILWNTSSIFDVDLNKQSHEEGRLTVNDYYGNEPPIILDENEDIPYSAVVLPNATTAQSSVWHPDVPRILQLIPENNPLRNTAHLLRFIIKPKQIIVPWSQYLYDMFRDMEIANPGIPPGEEIRNVSLMQPDIQIAKQSMANRQRPVVDDPEILAKHFAQYRFARMQPYEFHHLRSQQIKDMLCGQIHKYMTEVLINIPERMRTTTISELEPKKITWTHNHFQHF